jgi:serine phosphatase RsbU (regulator of sigma subunit)
MLRQLLIHERHKPAVFTTVCMARISPDRAQLTVWSAGHPLPLLLNGGGKWQLPAVPRGIPLGIDPVGNWSPAQIGLCPQWKLLLYTDGLIEGRSQSGERCLWVEGLLELLQGTEKFCGQDPDQLVNWLVDTVRQLDPGHDDDLAVVMLSHSSPPREPDNG